MSENDFNIRKRSEQMIEFFNSMKGKEFKEFAKIPFVRWLNGKIIKVIRGSSEFEHNVRPEMANPTNLLHGGIQCAMMDNAIGMAAATLGYKGFPISIDFHIDYLGKVKVGEKVRVIAKVVREGKNIIHMNIEILNMNGKLVSSGNSNLLKTSFVPNYVKLADELEKDAENPQ